MTKIRNAKQYNIGKHRFLELYHYCLQYPDWKEELANLTDTLNGIDLTADIKGSGGSSATEHLAIKRAELSTKCDLIEETAKEADADLYQYIIEGVVYEYATYRYLRDARKMPCGKNMYYMARKKFYYLLSQKL